jgi:hypothetical protein
MTFFDELGWRGPANKTTSLAAGGANADNNLTNGGFRIVSHPSTT